MNRLADYLSLHLLRKIGIRHRLIGAFVLLSLGASARLVSASPADGWRVETLYP